MSLSDISATRDYEKEKENETRLVAIGTMTAQLAHQIRTPLSSAILFTDHLNNSLIWMNAVEVGRVDFKNLMPALNNKFKIYYYLLAALTIKPKARKYG